VVTIPKREGPISSGKGIEFGASLDKANGKRKLDMSQGL